MVKGLCKLSVVLSLSWCGSAAAALLPSVHVNGQEWLQPLDFVNTSWNDIASVCDISTGACNGSLNGNDLAGWSWASVPNLNALFIAFGIPGFTDSRGSFTVDSGADSLWAPLFLESFKSTGRNSVAGLLRTGLPDQTGFGVVADDATVFGDRIWDIANNFGSGPAPDDRSDDTGGWFYRDHLQVPIPSTLSLIGLSLAALGFSRRKYLK